MKKCYLFIIFTFISIFIFNSNVKANTASASFTNLGLNTTIVNPTQSWYQDVNFNSGSWANWGEGTLIFTISNSCTLTSCDAVMPITSVTAFSGDSPFVCEMGSLQNVTYPQNTPTYTFKCNMVVGSSGITRLRIHHNLSNYTQHLLSYQLSDYFTFVQSGGDSAGIVSAVENIYSSFAGQLDTIRFHQREVNDKLNITNDRLNQSNANTNDIKNNTKETNDLIKDDNVDSASSSASEWNSKNASNGVITQLLTLPITLLNAIVSGIQTTCSSFNLGNLFGTDIILPCINLSSLIGSTLFTTIDLLISGFMIYNISKKLIRIFNDFTNLKSNQIDEIYGGDTN